MAKELADRVAALERALASREASSRPRTLIAEIEDVEERIEAMGYMDDDVVVEDVGDELSDVPLDDDLGGDEDVDFMDMDTGEVEDFVASESKPGIEDEINQDYLSAVVDLVTDGDPEVTDDSMLDAARSGSEGYVARLKSASARLDRVASHLEQTGRPKMALAIDKIADDVDARIKGGRR